jgi:mono/diheme cytochrome c family protein
MRLTRRVLVGLVFGIVVLAGIGLAAVEVRWTRRFEAPYPAVHASPDPAVIGHGEYLVYNAAACAYCHVPRSEWSALAQGKRLALTGDHLFRLPFGEIYSANLTPDSATGIGRRSDGDLARILRYGVRADHRAAFPLMEIRLTDEDLVAVISYLRAQPAVSHSVPEHKFSLVGKALMAFAIGPEGRANAPSSVSPVGATVARGAYLANDVSSCVSCHTDRGPDGALTGPPFSGGQRMDVAADSSKVYVSPNLTPDAQTSPVGRWSATEFVARFRAGEQLPGTPMPWGAFAGMTETDLRAIYNYLRSLPPTVKQTGAPIQAKGGGDR